MASLMNGLSALGAGVSAFAGTAGLEQQKASLAQAQTVLADQLATTRETGLQQSAGDIAAKAAATAQTFTAGQNTQQQAAEAARQAAALAVTQSEGAANRAAEATRQQVQINAPPETIKLLRALGVPLPGDATPAGASGSSAGTAPLPGPRATGGTAADGSAVPPLAGGSAPAPGAAIPSTPDPMDNPLVRKALGMPADGSPEATRMAIAKDVSGDPAFKYKTAGQKAAEVELRVAIAEGKMTDPAARESMAQGIASYQIAPLASFALTKPGGPETMARALQLNPDYQESRYPEVNKAMSAFGSGKQGDIVRSLNVGVQHLEVLDQAGQALGNGDVRALNSLKNTFQQQFGAPAPTTFDGLKQIVGTEIEKSVAGGIGSASDRDRIMKALDAASSPAQLQAITDGFRSLMIGQLSGLKTQYEEATGFKGGPFVFESKLVPETIKALHAAPAASTPAASSAPPAPDPIAMARDAISQGAPRDAVIKRLRDNGIDPSRILTGLPPALDNTPGQD